MMHCSELNCGVVICCLVLWNDMHHVEVQLSIVHCYVVYAGVVSFGVIHGSVLHRGVVHCGVVYCKKGH